MAQAKARSKPKKKQKQPQKPFLLRSSGGCQYEHIKTELEGFATSLQIPGSEVITGMGAILSGSKEIWQILRPSDSVLVRMDSVKRSKTKRQRVESSNKSRKIALKPKYAMKRYWARMTKEERSAEMARRRTISKKKAA